MSGRFPMGLVIAIFVVLALVVSWRFMPPIDWKKFVSTEQVRSAPTDSYAMLDIKYANPPIFEERYQMEDRNGVSTFSYTVVRAESGRARLSVTVKAPPTATYEVSFFFGQLVTDGVWNVPSRPPRGDTSVAYALAVRQVEDYRTTTNSATFTDPHYWATTAGREFHIHLSPHGPLPNLLQLQGTGVRDPRYEQLVNDFRNFGPPNFRAAIVKARGRPL